MRIQKRPPQNPATTFVELAPAERVGWPLTTSTAEAVKGWPECVIELEHPRGAKMRIRLTGRQSPEVVTAVSQVFFGAGS